MALLFYFTRGLAADPLLFNEDELVLFSVHFPEGLSAAESIELFRQNQKWFVPLGTLADALKINLQVSPKLGKAHGFFLQEDTPIHLDLTSCQIQVGDKKHRFPCDGARRVFKDQKPSNDELRLQ